MYVHPYIRLMLRGRLGTYVIHLEKEVANVSILPDIYFTELQPILVYFNIL